MAISIPLYPLLLMVIAEKVSQGIKQTKSESRTTTPMVFIMLKWTSKWLYKQHSEELLVGIITTRHQTKTQHYRKLLLYQKKRPSYNLRKLFK